MKRFVVVIMTVSTVFLATAATAYVGPGAAVTLVGALWAVVAAVVLAVVGILIWPIRLMLRRMRGKARAEESPQAQAKKEPAAGDDSSAP